MITIRMLLCQIGSRLLSEDVSHSLVVVQRAPMNRSWPVQSHKTAKSVTETLPFLFALGAVAHDKTKWSSQRLDC